MHTTVGQVETDKLVNESFADPNSSTPAPFQALRQRPDRHQPASRRRPSKDELVFVLRDAKSSTALISALEEPNNLNMASVFAPRLGGVEYVLGAKTVPTATIAACLGVSIHTFVLRHLQPEEYLHRFVGAIAFTALLLVYLCFSLHGVAAGLTRASLVALSFNGGLFLSITIYRLCFHPLRKFPGPVGAKLSRFYVTAVSAKEVKYHKVIKKWSEKYGDFIRTGGSN
ncbi:MAG: hypothetical protein Q9227_004923 [Pyrenula ochraceoflavens]